MIRTRQPADLDRCVAARLAVHRADAYPLNWPADPHRWLSPPRLRRGGQTSLIRSATELTMRDGRYG